MIFLDFTSIIRALIMNIMLLSMLVLLIIFIYYIFYIVKASVARSVRILKKGKKITHINEFDDIDNIKVKEAERKQIQNELNELEQRYISQYMNSEGKVSLRELEQGISDLRLLYNHEQKEEKNIYESVTATAIVEDDDSFDVELFKKWAKNIFIYVQIGTIEELEKIKHFMADDLFDKKTYTLKAYERDGLELVRNDLLVKEINFYDYGKALGKEKIQMYVEAKLIEYIRNKETDQVIRGKRSQVVNKSYLMTFVKKECKQEEIYLSNCPNCGAEVSQTEFGKCKYCNSFIIPIRYNWTLTKIEKI